MIIRKGTLEDLEQIADIESRVFTHPWNRDQIRYELINQPVSRTWVIVERGQLFGYLMAHEVDNEVQIINIAIDIVRQHRGYGKSLLNHFLNRYGPGTTIFLEVRKSNLNAIKLYIDAGFEEIGRRDSYYEDGETAIVMRLVRKSPVEKHAPMKSGE
jgi:ribosomal-protein-alanine N-acetyltransferase